MNDFQAGKLKKAVTFSYDDAITQDVQMIELMNKYGIKGTFNLNSQLLGTSSFLTGRLPNGENYRICHYKLRPEDVKFVYEGHEVAVHTLDHLNLTTLPDEEVIRQVEQDRRNLSDLVGYEVVGMAYPCGGENNDERVAALICENTPIRYARTIKSTYSFKPQKENLHRYNPTVYYIEECFEEIADKFLSSQSEEEELLYIWGHSYEMDAGYISWEKFEEICKKLSGREDIFYGTNKEVLL